MGKSSNHPVIGISLHTRVGLAAIVVTLGCTATASSPGTSLGSASSTTTVKASATTAAPSTTSAAHHANSTTAASLEGFRNKNALYNRNANTNSASLPLRSLINDGTADPSWFKSNAFTPATGTNGQFRVRCEYSHLLNDDPIVKPGAPGAAHLHMFFGNTATNANSTSSSILNSGGSTCDGFELNRTAYWFPTLMDANGSVRIPNNMMVYYKGEGVKPPPGGYSEIPAGLKMIAGNPSATTPQRPADNFGWACGNMFTNPSQTTIPSNCTTKLMSKVAFPRCWNGRTDFDSPDATSFVVYASNGPSGGTCPADHPKVFPVVSVLFDWDLSSGGTAGWHLSSDMMGGKTLPGGTSMHGDWFGGWNQQVMRNWTQGCLNAEWNCQTGFIGNKNLIAGAPGTTNLLAPTPLIYMDKGPIIIKL